MIQKQLERRSRRAPQVRIISGRWRRTPLTVLQQEGLRPTPDRVRETVFNWLDHLLDRRWEGLRCLDLFAGSGALGFEAASRGAAQVVMVEGNPVVVDELESVKRRLDASQISIVRSDATAFLKTRLRNLEASSGDGGNGSNGNHNLSRARVMPPSSSSVSAAISVAPSAVDLRFDLIFADPPYRNDWLARVLPACKALLAPGGLLYVESEVSLAGDTPPDWMQGWQTVRAARAGMVHYHLLEPV